MNHYKDLISRTTKRQRSFELMLKKLENRKNPTIIETGCIRQPNSFDGDGMSSLIFDSYAYHHDGLYMSVDININHVNLAKSMIKKGQVFCDDSVKFLFELNEKFRNTNTYIDLLYLDSFDLDQRNPHPSSLHHIMELLVAWPSCKPGTIVCVDDNLSNGIGKGTYIHSFMELISKKPIFNEYQIIWEL